MRFIFNSISYIILKFQGAYQVKNYVYDGDLSVPTMYGDFMIDLYLTRQGVQLICVKLFVKTDPKGKTKPTG